MIVVINRDAKISEIKRVLNKLNNSKKKKLSDFYGKLKGAFGDGLAYQEKYKG